MSDYNRKLNYKEDGHEIFDEKFSITNNNKIYKLKHDNVDAESIQIYTQENMQGTKINDVSIGKNYEKDWETILTLGGTVMEGTYYVSYVSFGDENDADDINEMYEYFQNYNKKFGIGSNSYENKFDGNIDNLFTSGIYGFDSWDVEGTIPSDEGFNSFFGSTIMSVWSTEIYGDKLAIQTIFNNDMIFQRRVTSYDGIFPWLLVYKPKGKYEQDGKNGIGLSSVYDIFNNNVIFNPFGTGFFHYNMLSQNFFEDGALDDFPIQTNQGLVWYLSSIGDLDMTNIEDGYVGLEEIMFMFILPTDSFEDVGLYLRLVKMPMKEYHMSELMGDSGEPISVPDSHMSSINPMSNNSINSETPSREDIVNLINKRFGFKYGDVDAQEYLRDLFDEKISIGSENPSSKPIGFGEDFNKGFNKFGDSGNQNTTMNYGDGGYGDNPIPIFSDWIKIGGNGEGGGGIDEATVTSMLDARLKGDKVEIGKGTDAKDGGITIGENANASGNSAPISAISIGRNSKSRMGGIAFGLSAEALSNSVYYNGSRVAIGNNSKSLNDKQGVLGSVDYTDEWIIPGDLTVEGTKNFEMPHPKPEKSHTHRIRHSAVETNTAGDNLYRFIITSTKNNDIQTIDLPDYFIHLNKDVQIFVTPQGHFGNGYGILNEATEQLEIHCQLEGDYNVLAIGTRNDNHQSVQDWDIKGVEREIGESWTGETYVFEVEEIIEIEEIKEEEF